MTDLEEEVVAAALVEEAPVEVHPLDGAGHEPSVERLHRRNWSALLPAQAPCADGREEASVSARERVRARDDGLCCTWLRGYW